MVAMRLALLAGFATIAAGQSAEYRLGDALGKEWVVEVVETEDGDVVGTATAALGLSAGALSRDLSLGRWSAGGKATQLLSQAASGELSARLLVDVEGGASGQFSLSEAAGQADDLLAPLEDADPDDFENTEDEYEDAPPVLSIALSFEPVSAGLAVSSGEFTYLKSAAPVATGKGTYTWTISRDSFVLEMRHQGIVTTWIARAAGEAQIPWTVLFEPLMIGVAAVVFFQLYQEYSSVDIPQ
ncbi:hypothetical protein DIPPA_02332 [Diplonema papillatum]|nr:hypothetical protein DIPPA_02332 [Diplonema papillatum]